MLRRLSSAPSRIWLCCAQKFVVLKLVHQAALPETLALLGDMKVSPDYHIDGLILIVFDDRLDNFVCLWIALVIVGLPKVHERGRTVGRHQHRPMKHHSVLCSNSNFPIVVLAWI